MKKLLFFAMVLFGSTVFAQSTTTPDYAAMQKKLQLTDQQMQDIKTVDSRFIPAMAEASADKSEAGQKYFNSLKQDYESTMERIMGEKAYRSFNLMRTDATDTKVKSKAEPAKTDR